ncbi:hypothetical protein [Rickettsia endosymbiont of Ceutorhynchus obstrictus]|uniref:hypothetical protein n=1 Tax=Rickettsia endosymbiont of Ceutorhynchus obstrictus TaxID=3066249 RepID=UPI003132E532
MADDKDAQLENAINALKAQLAGAKTPGEVQRVLGGIANLPTTDDPKMMERVKGLEAAAIAKENNLNQGVSSNITQANIDQEHQIEQSQKEIDSLKEIGKALEKEYPAFENLSNKYIEEKEEELKKLQALRNNIEDNLKNNKPIPQEELDKHIKSPEQVNKDRETVRKTRDYHKKVTNHHDNLTNKIGELEKSLENKNLTKEQRAEITKQLTEVKTEHAKHSKVKEKVDKQLQKTDASINKLEEEQKEYSKVIDKLPDSHPEKPKLKSFARLKKEEHIAITTDTELPKTPERDAALKRAEVRGTGDDVRKPLSKNTVKTTTQNKIGPPYSTPSKGGGPGPGGPGGEGRG